MTTNENTKMYITAFDVSTGKICIEEPGWKGELFYHKVTPIWSETPPENWREPIPGSRFLYEDYSSCLTPGETFYEIVSLVIDGERRKGHATDLFNLFFNREHPTSIVIEVGIINQELYFELKRTNALIEYMEREIVPFWKSVGFTDVNGSTFAFEEHIPMLWPKEKADLAFKIAHEWEEAHKAQENAPDDEGVVDN